MCDSKKLHHVKHPIYIKYYNLTFHFTPEKSRGLKDEGNEYFKEKNYKKAVVSYTEGLKMNCMNPELNALLYTNRAAAHFHLGKVSFSPSHILCYLE